MLAYQKLDVYRCAIQALALSARITTEIPKDTVSSTISCVGPPFQSHSILPKALAALRRQTPHASTELRADLPWSVWRSSTPAEPLVWVTRSSAGRPCRSSSASSRCCLAWFAEPIDDVSRPRPRPRRRTTTTTTTTTTEDVTNRERTRLERQATAHGQAGEDRRQREQAEAAATAAARGTAGDVAAA